MVRNIEPGLKVEVTQQRGEVTAAFEGEIGLAGLESFRRALARASGTGEPLLVVNLTRVCYLDCGAIRSLLDAWRERGRQPGTLEIRVRRASTAWILHQAGLGAVVRLIA
jgi:anti-anti-sigma factor